MRAVVFHGVGDIRLEDVPEPKVEEPSDAIVRITMSAICGTDLHIVRGTMPGMRPGTILGHEGVGVVEQIGSDVRNLRIGDRVVIASTISCGVCTFCRDGHHAQCDRANPNGPRAGTTFFGGPEANGAFHGLQAEKARIPFANVGLVKLPDEVSDGQAILLSDVFPTGYFGAELAAPHPGCTAAVFGCGPVGQFAIASLRLLGAGRIFAVDCVPARLEMARAQGAEVINFDQEDPVDVILRLTHKVGVDAAIDAVGVDAVHAHRGPAARKAKGLKSQFKKELEEIVPHTNRDTDSFRPGDGPSQVLIWAVDALAKAGTLAIVGVYPDNDRFFPIGRAMNKNLTLRMGNCNHRTYIPKLIELVRTGVIDPAQVLTHEAPIGDAIEAYHCFDRRERSWVKVALEAEHDEARVVPFYGNGNGNGARRGVV
jgi:threonine dehydrogenase-like Zn-dependent dehydrogenase